MSDEHDKKRPAKIRRRRILRTRDPKTGAFVASGKSPAPMTVGLKRGPKVLGATVSESVSRYRARAPFDDDNPELTDEEFEEMRPASDVLPKEEVLALVRTRGAQKSPTKLPVSIRLSPEVVEYFKAGGRGWQTRLDNALRKLIGIDEKAG